MSTELGFEGKVVVITGAGQGLGRSHALLFASRGARVIVNDLGSSAQGGGRSSAAADKVVEEIRASGGEAAACYDSVEEGAKIVQAALDHFGRIDVVVNNAGILRDTSFAKMSEEDWDLIYRVHLLGAFRVTQAAWPHLRDQGYGRIVFTTSAAGIYGNFGQANYSSAKLGLVGFAQTLALEGKKRNVLVNAIAPIAGSRLTETVLPKELIDALRPEYVSPLVAYLCHSSCAENGGLFEVGGGFFGKLRWERAEGKLCRLGRTITPEAIAASWGAISSFEKTTHPADVTSSMQPILENLQRKSLGGNEFIDLDQAVGYEFADLRSSYDERDLALYALGVGAAKDPLDPRELRYVFELHGDGFRPLATYGVIPGVNTILTLAREGKQAPGLNYGLDRILHGEQYTELRRPLPPRATLRNKARIKEIFDKGKNALVVTEIRSFDAESGEELIYNELTMFVRGAGGWGGDRGPQEERNAAPAREPDAVVTETIGVGQALLYRLSGDWNPLHADPSFAKNFGFEKPILHGLCTFGYAGRHVVNTFRDGDPRFLKSIRVRFTDMVYPGETLRTEMWKESNERVIFRCKVVERDRVVIGNAAIELWAELPVAKKVQSAPKAAPAAVPVAAAAGPTTADVFAAIGAYFAKTPELSAKVNNTFLFKLANPESAWFLDLKSSPPLVRPGEEAADCTLELADADFMDMTTGKADPQKLYFGGKLKIRGNVMASQKLEFLKKIDAPTAKRAAEAPATAAPTPAAPKAPKAPKQAKAPAIFRALGERLTQNPTLAGEVGALLAFQVSEPKGEWVVDLRGATPSVREGAATDATTTLRIADEDLATLVTGTALAEALFMHGKLCVDGDLGPARKLSFLNGLVA